ncbi:MAG: hypothetical protein KBG29_10855 [Pseudomonadales bacterium]|nr:hypothetical protein [Pseudomonadales bacterium]MBP9034383.1 hypothetical protein [Pseudomonadales bacterium]
MDPGVTAKRLSFVLAVAMHALPAVASAPGWTRVDLEAHRFLMVATTTLRVTEPSPAALAAELVAVPGHAALPAPPAGVLRLDAESVLPGVTSRLSVWLARDSLQLLQRERVDSVRDGRYKLTRFLVDGSYEWQRRGGQKTRHLEPSRWHLKRERPRPLGPPAPCTDALGLLLLAAELVRGTEARAESAVCTDDAVVGVVLERSADAAGRRQGGAEAQESAARGRACRRVGISVTAPDAKVEDFRLLGLATGLSVCVDVASGAPQQVLGREPRLGAFTIEATRVETGNR